MATKQYSHKYSWGKLTISADFSSASSPIRYGTDGDSPTDSSPYQVADSGHSPKKALALVNRWLSGQGGRRNNPAKLPIGKMVRVKRDEVVTGYQANRDGTTSLLIEKKRRAPNPKRKPAKRKNPSVRKSKKYFKRAAKRLGVKLPKRVPRKVTHSKRNKKRQNPAKEYSHKYTWGRLKISADFSQSGSPIRYGTDGDAPTDSTPFQVADARHSPAKALALVNRWLRSQG